MGGSIDYIDDAGREWTHASRYRVLEEEIAALRKRVEELEAELGSYKHEAAILDTLTQRGITDCSTPSIQRVKNIVEALEKAEAERDKLQADLDAALLVCERLGVQYGRAWLSERAGEAGARVRELLAEREAKRG